MRPYFTRISWACEIYCKHCFDIPLIWWLSLCLCVCSADAKLLEEAVVPLAKTLSMCVCIIYCRFITAVCTKRHMLISNPLSCEIKVCNFRLCAHEATWFKWLPIPSPLCFYDVLYVIYCSRRFLIILLIWLSSSYHEHPKDGKRCFVCLIICLCPL